MSNIRLNLKVTLLILILISMFLFSCKSYKELPVVSEVNVEKYQGKWYEIARLPNRFERGLDRVTAEYTLRDDNKIDVKNKGYLIGTNEFKVSKGVARIPDINEPAKLKVSFFCPFSGNYWILELDDDYQYALIGEPSRKFLWILAREKTLDDNTIDKLLQRAKELNFGIDEIIMVNQNN